MLTVDPERLLLRPGMRVLDAGCGRGRHCHALALAGVIAVGVDLSLDDVRAARDEWSAIAPDMPCVVARADTARLPFADGAFDRVVCSEVLEHLPDWQAALAELDRVLKPGGLIALSVPRFWPEAVCWRLAPDYARTPGGHVRIFRKRELTQALAARGFDLFGTGHAHALHSPYWWLQCVLWRRRENSRIVALYRRFLEWDMVKQPRATRALERMLNPVIGKSLVLYARKPA